MRKFSLVGLGLVVVCAFSALATTSAFALGLTTAQWLVNGAKITANLPADTLGELLFEDTELGGAFLCSGLFEGTIGAEGQDETTMVFNLEGTLIEELDASSATGGLKCVADEKICLVNSEIWPVNLPFLTLLKLDTEEAEAYWDVYDLNANGLMPGYWIRCLTSLVTIEALCEAAVGAVDELLNVTGGVEPMGEFTPLGVCRGNPGIDLISNDPGGLITSSEGTVSVSE